ncbi:MAG: hypothetical protein JKY37_11200 [Nannocystaceae bacterium]|nr:hypothetical protein [Nannocystaceae bacterium]
MSEPDADVETEDDGVVVPPASERKWLLTQLAAMVKRFGPDRILVGPMPWPDETWFPDKWGGGEASMRRLIRRLMSYAGMPDDPVEVIVEDDAEASGVAGGGSYASVWFLGRRNGVVRFAAQASALRSPLIVVPHAARAVAEAFLRLGGITITDETAAQRLVDLAGVYLGFGVLTVNAAIRHLTGAQTGFRSTRSRSRLGVLAPQSIAFAFAAVTVARQLPDKDARRVAKSMQANPAEFFRAARTLLKVREPSVAEVLALPLRDRWPEPPNLDELRAPLSVDDDGEPEVRRDEEKGVTEMNTGKPVFRVERSKALRLGKMLALPVVMLGMLASRMNVGIEIPMWQVGVSALVLGLLGLGVGRLLPDSRCSEPKCGVPLAAEDKVCGRCGGTVMGVIHHPKERLAAEEALTTSPAAPPTGDAKSEPAP